MTDKQSKYDINYDNLSNLISIKRINNQYFIINICLEISKIQILGNFIKCNLIVARVINSDIFY